jgi:hypothetical protein
LLIRLHGSIHSKRLPTARRLLALPLQQPIQKRKETKTYPRLSCKIEYLLNVKSQRRINRFRILHGRLVNTSFNVRGEPIVCTPEDAFRCFMGSELDLLVIGKCVARKCDQNPDLRQNYSSAFELD